MGGGKGWIQHAPLPAGEAGATGAARRQRRRRATRPRWQHTVLPARVHDDRAGGSGSPEPASRAQCARPPQRVGGPPNARGQWPWRVRPVRPGAGQGRGGRVREGGREKARAAARGRTDGRSRGGSGGRPPSGTQRLRFRRKRVTGGSTADRFATEPLFCTVQSQQALASAPPLPLSHKRRLGYGPEHVRTGNRTVGKHQTHYLSGSPHPFLVQDK